MTPKKPIITLFILFFLNIQLNMTFSQTKEFAPVGAIWYYSFYEMVMPVVTFSTLTCYGDTLIQGKNTKKISGGHFLYENNRQIFLFQPQLNDFTLLYDFNKNTGESWEIVTPLGSLGDTFTVFVDSTSYEVVNSDTLKVQYIRSLDMLWEFNGKTIEYIGNTIYLFPQYGLADPQTGPLRCYEDVDYTYHHWTLPCDTSIILHSCTVDNEDNIHIYPNPFNDDVSISFTKKPENHYTLLILNQLGNIVAEEIRTNEAITKLDLSLLKSGVYFIIMKNEMRGYYRKIIKL